MSGIGYSTRRFAFAAGHRYWVDAWSAGENERTFGRLVVPHGHNYTVDVTIARRTICVSEEALLFSSVRCRIALCR